MLNWIIKNWTFSIPIGVFVAYLVCYGIEQAVYSSLGFGRVSERVAVEYYVDRESFERVSERKLLKKEPSLKDSLILGNLPPGYFKIRNRGSAKYLLQLA